MKWTFAAAIALLCVSLVAITNAQERPALNPLKPTADYVKRLRRYQKLQANKAAAQRKLADRFLTADIEAAGLEQYLSRRCQNGVLTGDCVPDNYGVNPLLEMFVPLAPPPPPAPPAPAPRPDPIPAPQEPCTVPTTPCPADAPKE